MREFFKFAFASAVGFIIGSFLLLGLLIAILSAVAFTFGSDTEVSIQESSVLHITFDAPIAERTSKNPFQNLSFTSSQNLKALGLNDILKNIEKAKRDENIKGVFLDLTSVSGAPATIEEIRNALIDFKSSKKFIYTYSEYMTQGAYYLASVSDRIYLHPEGGLDFRGLGSEMMFFKGALEKLEIEPQIIRHGKYKSAIEPFLLDKMSPENRLQMEALLGSIWSHMLNGISKSRGISVAELQRIADEFATRDPKAALSLKMVDKVAYYDELLKDLQSRCQWKESSKPKFVGLSRYDNAIVKSDKEFSNKKIAVIYAVGEINSGEAGEDAIGSTTIAGEIRKARLDTAVKAIVLRVNSPGGSALASDVIWREMILAKKAKPVVASMGDYAASGGYYISCAADSIVAEPTTITGSIGVFGLMFNAQKMFNNKLGITFDTVKTGRFADMGSMTRPMREDERAMIEQEIEKVYDVFITHVSEGRRISKAAVDSIGQGRVWTGLEAINIGLVDKIGTLEDAVAMAAKLARLDNYRVVPLPRQKEFFEVLMEDFSTEAETYFAKRELGESYRYYAEIKKLVQQQGIMARMPYTLNIH